MKEILEERNNYHVDFKVESTIIRANITLIESVTNNEVYANCYPNCTVVQTIKVDGIEYENEGYTGEVKFREIDTNKLVRNKEKIKYLMEVANDIIRKGNEYIVNTFGNIDKKIIELYDARYM